MIIPIDFVAGSHGNFLETILNKHFNLVDVSDTFTDTGTSHSKTKDYHRTKVFSASHWFEKYPVEYMRQFDRIVSIRFSQDDLLLLSSVSLLRAGDMNIDNDSLEVDTRNKLNNRHYGHIITQIDQSYPFLNPAESSIPRNILREFFKFGFRSPEINGYWIKQLGLTYPASSNVFYFEFSSFYNIDKFVEQIKSLENFVNMKFNFSDEFFKYHQRFLSFIPYITHKQECDTIISCVNSRVDKAIPKLSLFQESYINGVLEQLHHKEMPFHPNNYFKSTAEMLYYIENQAPEL